MYALQALGLDSSSKESAAMVKDKAVPERAEAAPPAPAASV